MTTGTRILRPLLCFALLLALLVPSICAAETAEEETELVYSRVIDVPGVGSWQYYAQNDPLWAKSIYEPKGSDKWRIFCESGCGPTAAAIALSRQVDTDDLLTLLEFKSPYQDGFEYCPCSINGYRCDRTHEKMTATTTEDFKTYLPVIIASYAAGNNKTREKYRSQSDGTSLELFRSLAKAYNLHYVGSSKWEDAYEALQEGYSVVTTVGKGVFTQISHFLVIAYADEDYIYVLDPYMRENYDHLDRNHLLEIIEPGLVRAKTSDFNKLGFSGYYMFRKPIPFGRNVTDVTE